MKTKVGDVFSLQLDIHEVAFGQILKKLKYELFIAVFPESAKENELPDLASIVGCKPVLLGLTLDGMLYSGDWKVIGNTPSKLTDYPLPFYKIGTPPDVFLLDFNGKRIREAKNNEIEILDYRTTLSPVYYEEAIKAWHGKIPWNDEYNGILYDEVIRKRSIVKI